MDLETSSAPSDRPANEPCNNANRTNSNSFPRSAKRVRLSSAYSIPRLGHNTTPLPLYNEDWKGSTEDTDSSNYNGSRDDDISSKRQEFSAPAGVKTALNGHNAKLIRSPSVISEDEEDNVQSSIDIIPGRP
jgi:hypothetical protein